MDPLLLQKALLQLLPQLGLNVFSVTLLMLGMYYPRHHDKEQVTTAMMFNFAVFAVLTVLAEVDFGIAAGFGLFAILALFRLRSEQFSKVDMSYFFGAVAIGVICAIQGTSIIMDCATVALVLLGAWALDHPRVLHAVGSIKITLDRIDPHVLANGERMRSELGQQLGVNVVYYEIKSLDYVRDMAAINVYYHK